MCSMVYAQSNYILPSNSMQDDVVNILSGWQMQNNVVLPRSHMLDSGKIIDENIKSLCYLLWIFEPE